MARIRTIKPEFWMHEVLSQLPEATHMLAAALLNYADDEGYFNANPGLVKAATFPLREPSVSIQDSIKSLEQIGFIRTCTGSDGKRYGHIVTFDAHQRVNRPTPSKINPLCDFTENSVSAHEKDNDTSSPERKGKEQGKEQGTGKGDTHSSAVLAVFEYWQAVMGKRQAILTPKRERVVKAALKLGYTIDQIKAAIDGCKRSPFHMGVNDQRTVYDDLELICRNGENIEKFINNIGAGSGVETIDMTHDRIQAQADRVAAYLEDVGA